MQVNEHLPEDFAYNKGSSSTDYNCTNNYSKPYEAEK